MAENWVASNDSYQNNSFSSFPLLGGSRHCRNYWRLGNCERIYGIVTRDKIANTTSQLDITWKNRHSFGVDRAQIGVRTIPPIRFRGLLKD